MVLKGKGRAAGLDGSGASDEVTPVIVIYPFALEAEYDFGEWLMEYLPE